jgi:hypothetical protein
MKTEFTVLVQQLIAEQGRDALFNIAKCKAFLVAAQTASISEKRLLQQAVESGITSGIANARDIAAYKSQAVQKLQTKYFFAPNVANGVVDMLIGMIRSAPPAQKKQMAPPNLTVAAPKKPIPRNRILAAAAMAAVLIVLVGIVAITKNGKQEIVFEPVIEFHGEAFPVKALSIASMNTRFDGSPRILNDGDYIGDSFGDFGVSLSINSNSIEKTPVRVEVEGDRFVKLSKIETNVPSGKKIELFPRMIYDYPALEQIVQPSSVNITFRLFIHDKLHKEIVEVVRFHSVNEVPILKKSRLNEEDIIDHQWLFAAFVNEDDPFIDKIFQEALRMGTADAIGLGTSFSFSGYQDSDGDGDLSLEVDLQVLAVWAVFQQHNIKYSNITTTSTGNESIETQYVRTPQESFENTQANCVDGCVLFASVLRRLGIEPFLVLVPGHMFLGYYLDPNGTNSAFLETTMLGSKDITKYPKNRQAAISTEIFRAAQEAAKNEFSEVSDKIADESNMDYQIISIPYWRSRGVMPIKRF